MEQTHVTDTPSGPPVERPFPIVGIGASAGGYEAFAHLLEAIPGPIGAAFIFVQHLDPTHESMLASLLSRVTAIPVEQARDGVAVAPDHIYVAPPGQTLTILNGVLKLEEPSTPRFMRMPVDSFFRSLAQDKGNAAIGVILSGTGTDGTLGLWRIKEEGGIALVQDPVTAKFSGMPQSAIAETAVDFTLPPEGIARELLRLSGHPYVRSKDDATAPADPAEHGDETSLKKILAILKASSGVDFAGYKQATIIRRTVRRMTLLDQPDLAAYAQYCQQYPAEVTALYHDLLIKVTSFFRDPESFDVLKDTIFPTLFKDRPIDQPFRIWVPGCSTGEEAYSIAMVLLEYMQEQQILAPSLQIFATDLDEAALDKARRGMYLENIAADVSPERLERFFLHADHTYTVSRQVRELCTFARHNLLTDPPFSNVDVISCRNLFIYLDLPAQRRVIPNFHYALAAGGYLTLGLAETITAEGLFTLVDSKHKVYLREGSPARPVMSSGEGYSHMPRPATQRAGTYAPSSPGFQTADITKEAERTLLNYYGPVGALVNEQLDILHFQGDTSRYLAAPAGKASLNLVTMAREGLLPDLRAAIEQAKATGEVATREGVTVTSGEALLDVTLRIVPIHSPQQTNPHYMVLIEQPSQGATPRKAAPAAKTTASRRADTRKLSLLRNELESAKAYLQSTVEDRDTANEELRSANEEVLSANEELQSTNEELETAKEELQSTNEELTTSNEEVRRHNEELARRNDDLHNLFNSSHLPIVLLDEELRIRQFSTVVRRVLNVIPTDVGRPITDLRLNVSVPSLEKLIRRVIAGGRPIEREVQNEEGNWYLLRIAPYKTTENRTDGAVLLLIDISAIKDVNRLTSLLQEREEAEADAQAARAYAESIVETVRHPIVVLDAGLRVKSANRAFYDVFQVTTEETIGGLVYDTGGGQWGVPGVQQVLEGVLPDSKMVDDLEITQEFPRIGRRTILLNARAIEQAGGGNQPMDLILLAIEDITERKQAEDELRQADRQKDEFLAMLSHELRNPLGPLSASVGLLRSSHGGAPAETLDVVDRQLGTLTRLINDLLEVSRVTTGRVHLQQTVCALNTLVQRAVDTVRPQINARGHELSLSLANPPVWIHSDETRMEQVLVNLLTNAAKYTPDGGHIWLSVDREDNGAVVRLRDSGAGIEPELLPRLFDLFSQGASTLDRSESGLGVGLSLAKSLVEAHGGRITAASDGPGKGSEFVVHLPVTTSPPTTPAVDAPAQDGAGDAGGQPPLRVLVVDDSVDMTKIFGKLLQRNGHEVRTANSGADAIATGIEFQPQVVLLDIGLPEMDGYEVARRMRLEPALRDVVLVAMTGYGMESDRELSREAGFDHHLVKPADLGELNAIFKSAAAPPRHHHYV